MVEMKFVCDRMLGKLAIWLRISGYDTIYAGDIDVENEDNYLLTNFLDRILLTKDRRLFEKAKKIGRAAVLLNSNSVAEQMKELMTFGVKFQIVMDRCSVCNTLLRKPTEEEAKKAIKIQNLPEKVLEEYEVWFCEKCVKLYWMGSHWRNMVRFLEKLED